MNKKPATAVITSWSSVAEQLKELLTGRDSTVILLVVDQSTTTITQHCTTGVNALNSPASSATIVHQRDVTSSAISSTGGIENDNTINHE